MGMPDWASEIPSAPVHQGQDNTQLTRPFTTQQLQEFGKQIIEQFLKRVVLAVVGSFIPGIDSFDQLRDWAGRIPGLAQIIELIDNLPLNAQNIVGSIMHLLTRVPIGALTDASPNLLPDTGFATGSIAGAPDWIVDPVRSRTADGTGAAKLVLDGRMHALRSGRTLNDVIPVAASQKFSPTFFISHEGYTGTGAPIVLQVVPYVGGVAQDPVELAAYAPAAADMDWPGYELTGTYTVPDGVTGVQQRILVLPTATAGTLYVDDPSGTQPGKLRPEWVDGLPEALQDALARWQLLVDTMYNAITGAGTMLNQLEDLAAALTEIPFANIGSILGSTNLGGDLIEVLNSFVGGLVGQTGTGASPADAFNIAKMVSTWANRGQQAKEVTDTRTNKAATGGLGVSEKSNFALSSADAWLPTTQSTSLIGWDYVEEDMPLGVVSWIGYGVSGITAVYVHIWKVDLATGAITPLHSSGNVVGIISGAGSAAPGAFIQYELPDPINITMSDLLGYEIVVVGGTHNVRGRVYSLPAHPTAPIAKLAATRNNTSSPSTPPSSIAKASITWSDNAPWVGIAIDTGSGAGHRDPQTIYLGTMPTTIPIPPWCATVLAVANGDGGGGHLGGSWGFAGDPGEPGKFAVARWECGTDFTGDSTVITFTPGPGGIPGSSPLSQNGGDGQGTTLSIPGHSVTAAGGKGGKGIRNVLLGGAKPIGRGPGVYEYADEEFQAGGDQSAYAGDGMAPGGGGNGGNWSTVSAGGRGAPGGGWVVFLPGNGTTPPPPDTTPPTAPTLSVDSATFSSLTVIASGATD